MRALSLIAVALGVGATMIPSAANAQGRCYGYAEGDKLGKMDAGRIDEASGLAASWVQPGVYWVHNDSGDDERIFAVSDDGDYYGQWKVRSADADDWEDIALGPCDDASWRCLWIADTGDNDRERDVLTLYRVAEPDVDPDRDDPHHAKTARAEAYQVAYPDGHPRDAEAIFVDLDGAVYIATKWDDAVELFKLPDDAAPDTLSVLEEVGVRLDVSFVTGADMAPDGSRFVLRGDETAWEFTVDGATIADAFQTEPLVITLIEERQGEAIAYSADGQGFLTTSERAHRPIYYYECLSFDGPLPVDDDKSDRGGVTGGGDGGGCVAGGGLAWPLYLVILGTLYVTRRGRRRG